MRQFLPHSTFSLSPPTEIADRAVTRAGPRIEEMVEVQAGVTPEATAVVWGCRSLSYAELDRRANQLAHHLRALGARPETTIGVCLPRSIQTPVALLGILKSGAAYVPLDPRHPPERQAFMLADAGAEILIGPHGVQPALGFAGRLVDLEAQWDAIGRHSDQCPSRIGTAADLAYVLYTSGSTGVPKGVMLEHTASGVISWAKANLSCQDVARVAATTSLTFDPSILEIFAPLCMGGTVLIKENALAAFSDDEQPTMLIGAPSVLDERLRAGTIPASVRVIVTGGEAVRAPIIKDLYQRTKVRTIYNHYGPTEATTVTLVARIAPDMVGDPPIGRPIDGAVVRILDPDGKETPAGVPGEVFIGGAYLARGYLNQPDLTRSRFSPLENGGRFYRTGDIARLRPDGALEFVARVDEQIKLSGIRTEPGEIDAALLKISGVKRAITLVRTCKDRGSALVSFVEQERALLPSAIRQSLARWLPPHMVPAEIVLLDVFPSNVAGKIDRAALLALRPVMVEPAVADPALEPASPPEQGTVQAELHRLVAQAWRRALPAGPADPAVSWEAAGGTSLRLLQLAVDLGRHLHRSIPFEMFSGDVTQRELVRRLSRDPDPRQAASDAVVYLVPGVFGDEQVLADFRFSFANQVRFELVDMPDIEDSGDRLHEVGVFGRHVAAEILRRCPDQPFVLAGYSYGGIVAVEAAKALQATGRAPCLLILFDSNTSTDNHSPITEIGAVRPLLARALLAWSRSDVRRHMLFRLVLRLNIALAIKLRRTVLWNYRVTALQSWQPPAIQCPALIFVSDQFRSHTREAWRALAPHADIIDLPLQHIEIVTRRGFALVEPIVTDAVKAAYDAASRLDHAATPQTPAPEQLVRPAAVP